MGRRYFPRVRLPFTDERTDLEKHIGQQKARMGLALAALGVRVYPGSVFGAEKAARRARGKRQRLARKVHRGR